MQKISNPIPLFLDARGALLDGGKIYLGVAGGDPETSPVQAYWDSALSVEATQPLRTIGGRIVNGATPAAVFVNEDDYSMRIRASDDTLVDYSPSVFIDGISYQPLDSDLTAIAQLTTSVFGRNLLTLADKAALQNAMGYSQFSGGTISSDINKQNSGAYTYWSDPAMISGRIFITASGAADPTSLPGDIWFTY